MTLTNFPVGISIVALAVALFFAWLISYGRAEKPTLGDILVSMPIPGLIALGVVLFFWQGLV